MAMEQFVFLDRARLPTVAAWQAALDGFGVGVRLDPTFDLAAGAGFWPVTLKGAPSEIELFLDPVSDIADEEVPAGLGDRDLVVVFRTRNEALALISANYAAAALAHLADGLVLNVYDDGGGLVDAFRVLLEGRALESRL